MTAATGAGARAAAVEFLQREHEDAGPLVVLACIPARVFVKEETFLVHAVVAAPQQQQQQHSSSASPAHRAFVAVVTAERAVAFSAAFCGIGDAPQNGGLSNFAKLPNATPAECSLQFETDAVGREFHGAVRLALIGVPQLQPQQSAAEAAATKPMKLHAHGKRQSLLALFGRRRRGSNSDSSSSSDSRGTHSDGEERTEVSISFPHSVRHVAHCGRESAAAAEDVAATTAPTAEQPHRHHHHHHHHHHKHHHHKHSHS